MATTTTSPTTLTARINRIEVSATMAVVAEADKLRLGGADLADFGAGEPHFATPQHIKDAAILAIQQNFTKYTPVGGVAPLKDAIRERHSKDFGSDYQREEVIASTGGKHALFNAIVPVPYWVSFKDIIQYGGGVPVFVETDESRGFALTASMVERAITPRTKAIILNTPNNPSGAVMEPKDVESIVRLAHERGIYVIADECYVYLDYTGHRFSAASITEAKEHLVIIGSLSKTYAMTGWRMGYALSPAPITSAMQKLQSQSTSNPTSIVQKAAIAALTGDQQCIETMKSDYVRLRDHIVSGLREIPGIECQKPTGAFYAYPNVSASFGKGGLKSASDVASRLLKEAHVVTVPGEAFGTREHIRLSYATSMEEIDKGLERMKKWFAAL
jgi:aspartate aminotransferase